VVELRRIRGALAVFIAGLVLSGITAFPLQHELDMLARWCDNDWIVRVHDGVTATYAAYPFMGYGTDWLALGHIVIALFFVPVWRDPLRYVGNFHIGLLACALVPVVAFVCGPLRGIPFWWRVIDASFGLFGAIPLGCALRWTLRLRP
jgi:hypothetical protein